MRWTLIAVDFFATVFCLAGGTVAAIVFGGPWWLPVLALVYLLGFSQEARELMRRLTRPAQDTPGS